MVFSKLKTKLGATNFVSNYSKIWPYVKPYRFRALLALLSTVPLGATDAAIAWLLKPYTNTVMVDKNVDAGTFIPLLIIGFSLCQSFLGYASTYLNAWVGNRITIDLKAQLFSKMMRRSASFFDKHTSGDIQFRFNSDVELACSGLLSNLKLFTTRLFSSISLICVLITMSWQLAIIAIVALFGALYPLTKVRKKIKALMGQTVFSSSMVMTHYNEAFGGNRIVTSYNLYDHQDTRFKQTLKDVFKLGMKMIKKTGMISPMMHFIISIGIAGVIWFGSYLILNNHLTPGDFVSFIAALLMLYTPVKSMGSTYTRVQHSFMAMERVFELLEEPPEITSKPDAVKLQGINSEIKYENVWFEYEANRPVLKGINLVIEKGQTVAFVGNSGGGKTTMANILPRFYDIKSGAISIDGVDVRDMELGSLRDQISIVFQDNFLFAGTIRENITFGMNVSEDLINNAIKSACLDEFIASLGNGIDTEIGERGVLLSGGQKQRVAIARAFLKNAPIVILDEATSALDNKSEAIVQEAIQNLMHDRTVIVIAHRLSTVKNASKIVVVNHGEIVEVGTHNQLVEKDDGIYASLYKTQLT